MFRYQAELSCATRPSADIVACRCVLQTNLCVSRISDRHILTKTIMSTSSYSPSTRPEAIETLIAGVDRYNPTVRRYRASLKFRSCLSCRDRMCLSLKITCWNRQIKVITTCWRIWLSSNCECLLLSFASLPCNSAQSDENTFMQIRASTNGLTYYLAI